MKPHPLLKLLAPAFACPTDDHARRVVADTLLEHGHFWGEFIVLQTAVAEHGATAEVQARVAALLKTHVETFSGPLWKVAGSTARGNLARKGSLVFERGFLVECSLDRTAPRPAWEAAVRAPHWATVRRVCLGIGTPHWWIAKWIQSAPTRCLSVVEIGHRTNPYLRLERTPAGTWCVVKSKSGLYGPLFAAFAGGLGPRQRARLTFAGVAPMAVLALKAALG